MASKPDRTPPGAPPAASSSPAIPPLTPLAAEPRPDAPPPAGPPAVPARPPAIVVRIVPGVEEKLRRTWSSCDELLTWLSGLMAVIEGMKGTLAGPEKVNELKRRKRARPRWPPPVWIESLEWTRRPDGSVEVIVNGVRVVLKPYLGALFLALAEDAGVSDDEGVGFKTLEALALRMAEITHGRTLGDKTINKYVHRLRRVLIETAGLTSDVIQSRHRLGRRLAIGRSTIKRRERGRTAPAG